MYFKFSRNLGKKALQLFIVWNYILISLCTGHIYIMLLSSVYNITGAVVPATISSHCCSIPFTLNGNVHYSCTDDGFGVGCFYGDRQWKLCRQPAGEFPQQDIYRRNGCNDFIDNVVFIVVTNVKSKPIFSFVSA